MKQLSLIALGLTVAGCSATPGLSASPGLSGQKLSATFAHRQPLQPGVIPACSGSRVGQAQCDALMIPAAKPRPDGGSAPGGGFAPKQLREAYNLPSSINKGAGQIVAIVDAYDNPNVASDLAAYRSYFRLGKAHFTKYNQLGQQSAYPAGDIGWGSEIDLDVDMVSASCPKCTIYLVEANSNGWGDLETAEAEAVSLGAHIITNSYGGSGGSLSYYDAPHVTYLASAGDAGYGLYDPADFANVIAVGGTHLVQTGGGGKRGWTESVWTYSGGGCSIQPKPAWQHDPGCAYRTGVDVSAVADPATGVAEYDTYLQDPGAGWFLAGGTSVATPFIAGIVGLAGNAAQIGGPKRFWKRPRLRRKLFPVTSGSNGSCNPTYLCTAGSKEYKSYSGPGGWGTPDGTGAF